MQCAARDSLPVCARCGNGPSRMNDNGEPETLDQLPPHSFESEQAVLGAVFLSPKEALAAAKARLPGIDAFYDRRHQHVWELFCEMDARREGIDQITVQARLE